MFETEKRKGIPMRGLMYLAAGVVIGAVGMMIVTLMSNAGERPDTEATSLPVIPTPAMVMDGTASAQTVLDFPVDPAVIKAFAVSEPLKQVAFNYWNGSNTVLEIRPWANGHIGKTPITKLTEFEYQKLSFNAVQPSIAASAIQKVSLFDLKTNKLVKNFSGGEGVYSPDGQWFATSQSDHTIELYRNSLDTVYGTLDVQVFPYDITFSADSTMLASVSVSRTRPNEMYVEIFALSNSERIGFYTLNGTVSSSIVFSPDNTHIAVASSESVHVLSIKDGDQRYFDTPDTTITRVAFDATGAWLAASGGVSASGEKSGIYVYPLAEPKAIPTSASSVQFLETPLNDVKDIQFVEAGLLVLDSTSTLTLYRWNGEMWGNPVVVLTADDLME